MSSHICFTQNPPMLSLYYHITIIETKKFTLTQYYQLIFRLIFKYCLFCCGPGSNSGFLIAFICHIFPFFKDSSSVFLYLHDLELIENPGQLFCRMFLSLDLFDNFSWLDWGYAFPDKNIPQGNVMPLSVPHVRRFKKFIRLTNGDAN